MATWGAFVVYSQLAKGVEPGKGVLDHPALGHWHEAAGGGRRPISNLMLPAQGVNLLGKLALIRLVCQ